MTDMTPISKQLPDVSGLPNVYIEFPVTNKEGTPDPVSEPNTALLLSELGVSLRLNEFSGDTEVESKGSFTPLTDVHAEALWLAARHYALKPKYPDFMRVLRVIAHRHQYHPVRMFLEGLQWDRQPRMGTWISRYLGAEDTPLNRAIGKSALFGMVRRILEPGCQHDHMAILESPEQGPGKSSALRILGGKWFADGVRLGMDGKETIECMRNVWVGEVGELKGQERDVESVKDFLSRREDRGRLVWDRMTTTVKRQFILFGTTNQFQYLKDPSGARRFHPFRCGKLDLDALARDRDQLLAEAYSEALGAPLWGHPNYNAIPQELWGIAAEAQEARRELSAIEERLRELIDAQAYGFILKADLRRALGEEAATKWTNTQNNNLASGMRKLGWEGHNKRQRPPGGGDTQPVFEKRGADGAAMPWLFLSGGRFAPGATMPVATDF